MERNRDKVGEGDGKGGNKKRLVTHRINYYAMKNNIAQDGTQVFIHTGDFEEE